jgi:hypothetical protein
MLLVWRAIAAASDPCETVWQFPLSFDGLNNQAYGVYAAVFDEADEDMIFIGGYVGTQPLIAKFDVSSMAYAWIKGV